MDAGATQPGEGGGTVGLDDEQQRRPDGRRDLIERFAAALVLRVLRSPIAIATVALLMTASGCGTIKPVAAIFVLDCSASARALRKPAAQIVLEAARSLDPVRDRITIYRLADDVVPLLPSSRPSLRTVSAALERYAGIDAHDGRGTAYGRALDAAIGEAELAHREGFAPTVAVLGDGADEPTRAEPLARKAQALTAASRRLARSDLHLALLLMPPKALAHFQPLWRDVAPDRVLAMTDATPISEVAIDLMQLMGR